MSKARSRFMLRIGQVKRATERRCEWTMPLFPLIFILEADGTLSEKARQMQEKVKRRSA